MPFISTPNIFISPIFSIHNNSVLVNKQVDYLYLERNYHNNSSDQSMQQKGVEPQIIAQTSYLGPTVRQSCNITET